MSFYAAHFSDPRRERAFLSAAGFTVAFATARAAIDAVAIFAGLLTEGAAGSTALQDLGLLPKLERRTHEAAE